MPDTAAHSDLAAELSAWASQPYGAPTATSEVNTIPDFFTVEAQTIFGTGRGRAEPAGADAALPIAA